MTWRSCLVILVWVPSLAAVASSTHAQTATEQQVNGFV